MVEITNGLQTVVVSNGAYREIFKPQGWSRVGELKVLMTPLEVLAEAPQTEESTTPEEPEQEFQEPKPTQEDSKEDLSPEDTELLLHPLADLTVEELKRVAELKGIDIEGVKLKNDIRAAIKNATK